MKVEYYGTMIIVYIGENDPRDDILNITLPDGYSYEKLFVLAVKRIGFIHTFNTMANAHYTFPPVNSHSPNTIPLRPQSTGEAFITINIEKFGQIPDQHYFDNTFEPILVTGDDGNKYNVIPSDQFK